MKVKPFLLTTLFPAALRAHWPTPQHSLATYARTHLIRPAHTTPRTTIHANLRNNENTKHILSTNSRLDHSLPYRTLAFYIIATDKDTKQAIQTHKKFLQDRGMVGRVYLSVHGINAQVSGTIQSCAEYRDFVEKEFAPQQPLFKEDPCAELAFPRLRVKEKSLVPQLGAVREDPASSSNGEGDDQEDVGTDDSGEDHETMEEIDLSNRGLDLSPKEWEEMMSLEGTKHILDVRNGYEWDVGRFEGARRPDVSKFSESTGDAFGLPKDPKERAEVPVMMYCTGGIRCEYFSAKLKAEGFQRVYKLQGGIQHYGNANSDKAAPPHWKGKLFVFDRRNTLPLGGGESEIVGKCYRCGAPTEDFINCGNIDCNRLHLSCKSCRDAHLGFCTDACASAPRRRHLADTLYTQGPRPGAQDPNRLSSVKPHNVRRSEFDARIHTVEEARRKGNSS